MDSKITRGTLTLGLHYGGYRYSLEVVTGYVNLILLGKWTLENL